MVRRIRDAFGMFLVALCFLLIFLFWRTLPAHGFLYESQNGVVDMHNLVSAVTPVQLGTIRGGELFNDPSILIDREESAYVAFGLDPAIDDRSDTAQFFTFYLRAVPAGRFSNVQIYHATFDAFVGLHESLANMTWHHLDEVTVDEQEKYYRVNGCNPDQIQSIGCATMPVSIPLKQLPFDNPWNEEPQFWLRVYRIVVDGEASYEITSSYGENNLVNGGLSLRQQPLERLPFTSEVMCEGQRANIVGSKETEILRGTEGDDVIVAMGPNNIVYGLGGNDVICIREGGGLVDGGEGNDEIHNQGGKSMILIGGLGDDFIKDGKGASSLIGGPGDDVLKGGAGHDILRGLSGNDRLYGDSGSDVCDGGKDTDRLDKSCELKN